MRPGSRTRLRHCLRAHPAGKGQRRSMVERDFVALIDGAHQLVKAPLVLVRDRLNTHVSLKMRKVIAERDWLKVFLLPAYSPDLNPAEGVWGHAKRSLANLAVMASRAQRRLGGQPLRVAQTSTYGPRSTPSTTKPVLATTAANSSGSQPDKSRSRMEPSSTRGTGKAPTHRAR
ncbi:transposase [Streptomyces noursei]|uniref:transposase n=1 Tax=Streptomyces sp. VTCC 41912 TaxID=3383243 RepID=UPI0035D9345B